jgi:hypothetical protein
VSAGAAWATTKEVFSRDKPGGLEVSVELKLTAGSNECGLLTVFPQSGSRHSGYNSFVGGWRGYFGAGVDSAGPARKYGKTGDLKQWQKLRIKFANEQNDKKVYFYLNDETTPRHSVNDNRYTKGTIRLGHNCRNFEYRKLIVDGKEIAMTEANFVQRIAYTGTWWEGQGRYDKDAKKCQDRSKSIYEYCAYRYLASMGDAKTVAKFVTDSGSNSTEYPSQAMGGCFITITACRRNNYPIGKFYDSGKREAQYQEAACHKRAQDFYNACYNRAYRSTPALENGAVKATYVPTGKTATYPSSTTLLETDTSTSGEQMLAAGMGESIALPPR